MCVWLCVSVHLCVAECISVCLPESLQLFSLLLHADARGVHQEQRVRPGHQKDQPPSRLHHGAGQGAAGGQRHCRLSRGRLEAEDRAQGSLPSLPAQEGLQPSQGPRGGLARPGAEVQEQVLRQLSTVQTISLLPEAGPAGADRLQGRLISIV